MTHWVDSVQGVLGPQSLITELGSNEYAILVKDVAEFKYDATISSLKQRAMQSIAEILGEGNLAIWHGVTRVPRDGGCLEELLAFAERHLLAPQPASNSGKHLPAARGIENLRAALDGSMVTAERRTSSS